jgi:hypothetical protein
MCPFFTLILIFPALTALPVLPSAVVFSVLLRTGGGYRFGGLALGGGTQKFARGANA